MRDKIIVIFDIVKGIVILILLIALLLFFGFCFFVVVWNAASENEFIMHDCTVADKFKRERSNSTDYIVVVSIPDGTAHEIHDIYSFYNYEIGESISIKKITYKFPKDLVKGYEINNKGDTIDEN